MSQSSKYFMEKFRLSDEELEKNLSQCVCLKKTVKFPNKIMVWSAISVHGTSRFKVVDSIKNQDKYTKVLETRHMPRTRE